MGEPISIEHLVVHVLSKNDTYDLYAHKVKIHKPFFEKTIEDTQNDAI
jgi:hypothetical protein